MCKRFLYLFGFILCCTTANCQIKNIITCGIDTVLLESSYRSVEGVDSINYSWSNGLNTKSIVVRKNGIYVVKSSSKCCSFSDSFNVTIIPLKPKPNFIGDTICLGDTLRLKNQSIVADTSVKFRLKLPSGETIVGSGSIHFKFKPQRTGDFSLKIIGTNGGQCTDSSLVKVKVHALPKVTFTGLAPQYCQGEMADTIRGFPGGGVFLGVDIFNIDTTKGVGIFNPTSPGKNRLVRYLRKDLNGCIGIDSQYVKTIFPQPKVYLTGLSGDYCLNDPIDTLSYFPRGAKVSGLGISLSSSSVDSAAYYKPTAPGSFDVITSYVDLNGCYNQEIQKIIVFDIPIIDLGKDTTIISGQQIKLRSKQTSPNYQYFWSNETTDSIWVVDNPGYYVLTVTDGTTQCSVSDTILINVASKVRSKSEKPLITLFPNPVQDILFVKGIPSERTVSITVYDLKGSVMMSSFSQTGFNKQQLQINFSFIPAGLYVINLDGYSFLVQKL